MQEDSKRLRIRSEDDELANTTVQSLRNLVGTLLQLAVVGGLLDQVD